MKKAGALAATVVLTIVFTSCDNTFNILSAVKDEVKAANDRYLAITSTTPAPNSQDINPADPILVVFDRDLDAASWTDFISAGADGAAVDMSGWSFSYNPAIYTLSIAASPLLWSKTITMTISTGLTAKDGSQLREPHSWSFTTKGNYLSVTSTAPASNSQNINPADPITVVFDRDLDVASWRDYISVSVDGAAVDISGWSFSYNSAITTLTMTPSPIIPNKTITITISTSLTAKDGSRLRESYSWSFETNSGLPGTPSTAPTVTGLHQRLFVQWSAVSAATSYEVWFNNANMSGTASRAATDVAATSYTISPLTNDTPYWVWIKAKNSIGISDFGPAGTGTPHVTAPFLTTAAVTNITGINPTFNADSGGEITDNGGAEIQECGVCWSTSQNPTHDDAVATASLDPVFSATMTGLDPIATYYVRAFAKNSTNPDYGYGNQVSFTTPSLTPTVTTTTPSPVLETTASSGGNVTSEGGSSVTYCGVCWGESPNPTTSGNHTTDGSGLGAFSSTLTTLSAKVTYHVRAYATNSLGTSYGNDLTYTHPGIPELTTSSSFTNITNESCVAYGAITYSGGYGLSDLGFCWSTNSDPTLAESHASGSMSGCYISGLIENTTYHVRAWATNTSGTGYGNDVTVTTWRLPVLTTTAASSITSCTAVSGGTGIIIGDGQSTFYDGKGICWSTSPSPVRGSNEVQASTWGAEDFSCTMTGLTASTTYYVRAWGTNHFGTGYGNQISFTTGDATLPVVENVFQNFGGTVATSGGNITSDGGAAVTDRGVCWGSSSNPTTSGNHTTEGPGSGTFSSSITGLTAQTVYHVRAYATNIVGTAYSTDLTVNSGRTWGSSYAGGLVFYNDGSGGGLVCATSDQSSGTVWELSPYTNHGTSSAIGTGQANTTAIVSAEGTSAYYAARYCDEYTGGSYSDWFLPSYDELMLLDENIGLSHNYWSSTETSADNALIVPTILSYKGNGYYYARAVRAF
jgi:hypothetical protein